MVTSCQLSNTTEQANAMCGVLVRTETLPQHVMQGNAPEAAIVASLRAKAKQRVLLLLDNAEDMALAEPEAQVLHYCPMKCSCAHCITSALHM